MPVLKKYADSNKAKDGYYVHAPVSGRNHPIPLQTPNITEKIYRRIGYKPKKKGRDGGVHVPAELTWTLYDVGLHWTEKSGSQGDPSDLDPDTLGDAAGPNLTQDDIETILKFTREYRGQYQSRIKDLKKKFTDKSNKVSDENLPSTFTELIKEYSNKPRFDDEVEELLDTWEPDSIKDDDYVPDEDEGPLNSSQDPTTRSEHLESLSHVPNLKTHLQEYEEHPWDIQSVTGGSTGLCITFRIDADSELKRWKIRDYRGTGNKRDFTIDTAIGYRQYSFEIEESFISDFNTQISYHPAGKFDIPLEDFIPVGEYLDEITGKESSNKIMHILIVDFHHLIPIIEEFFGGIASFELESIDPADHSVYPP